MTDIPAGTMCQRCRIHPATSTRADSVMEWAHGSFNLWCQCCVLNDWIRRVQEQSAKVPGWVRELETACDGQPLADVQALTEDNARLRSEAHSQWLMAHCVVCGKHYPDAGNAMNYAAPHPEGEWCYWPEPEILT